MSKRKYINALAKHFCNSLHIASHDLKKCIWLWVIYIKHIIIQKKYEPKEPFFKSFKDNNQYTQICCNTELKLTDNSYDLIFFEWAKKISRQPLLFFQRFPDKEYNYNFSGQEAFLSKVLVRKWGDGKLKSRLWDIKFVTIKSSKRRMTFMDDDNRIKLADLISKLPQEAVDALYKAAASLLGTASNKDNPACPYCGGHHVVKNGHKCGKQEYLCRQCGKTFVSTTHTLMAHSHQPKQVWEAVLMDTLAGDAIDYSAKQLEISHDCVFYMRHKILLGLHGLLEETGVCLGGVSELDETFVLDSYKGGSLPEDAARPARRHGAKAQKRGISDEYVCICTGVERKGDAIAGSINRAKPSSRELGKMFKGHIKEGTLVLCDGLKSYLALEKDTGCSVKDVTKERSGKFFNLNTVNNFHSFIKSRYKFYRGVATKYLNRYNDLFSIAYRQAREKAGQLCNQLLEVSSINRNYTNRDVKMRGLLDI